MLMAEVFFFGHPFGEELQINIEDGGAGGGANEKHACYTFGYSSFFGLARYS